MIIVNTYVKTKTKTLEIYFRYAQLTDQLLFKTIVQKSELICRREVVDPRQPAVAKTGLTLSGSTLEFVVMPSSVKSDTTMSATDIFGIA